MGEFPARGDPSDERFEPYQTIRARVRPPAPLLPPVHLAVQFTGSGSHRWHAGRLGQTHDRCGLPAASCVSAALTTLSRRARAGCANCAPAPSAARARRAHASTGFRPAATNPCFAARRLAIMHSHDALDAGPDTAASTHQIRHQIKK